MTQLDTALSRDAEHLCPEVPDCNGDSTHTLEDVICCALNILRGPPCPGCPPDTGLARPAPDVGVELGPPAFTAAGAEIEVRVHDLGEVGGAVLRLGFPADRRRLPTGDEHVAAAQSVQRPLHVGVRQPQHGGDRPGPDTVAEHRRVQMVVPL